MKADRNKNKTARINYHEHKSIKSSELKGIKSSIQKVISSKFRANDSEKQSLVFASNSKHHSQCVVPWNYDVHELNYSANLRAQESVKGHFAKKKQFEEFDLLKRFAVFSS